MTLSLHMLGATAGLAAETTAPEPPSPPLGLQYYGHYWVDSTTYGHHLNEVGDHCNLQWVEGVEGLKTASAKAMQCAVQVRWEFFDSGGGEGMVHHPIRPEYERFWNQTADAVEPYLDNVAAFYMLDEPFWNGASGADLDLAIAAVKARFPQKPIMVVFAVPSFSERFNIPAGADWLGFDCYAPIDVVSKHLQFLKSHLLPHQRLFLVPQSFLNPTAPTDEALADLNRQYYDLAMSDPLIIGLLNYGLYTDNGDKELPLTLKAQREIGTRVTSRQK